MDFQWIDEWTLLGPFPNPGRKNYDEPFSVEEHLRNGNYFAEDQEGLASIPVHANRLPITVYHGKPETIWYAGSEVWSPKQQEMFVFIGSEFFSKFWVNGAPAAATGATPHPWSPDRKYAKVMFHEGANDILAKVEAPEGRVTFSFAVYLGPPRSDAAADGTP